MSSSKIVASALVLALVGCGEGRADGPAPKAPAAASSPVAAYFPLPEGNIFHYVTDEGGEQGMLVARVHRTDETHAELRMSNAAKRFVTTSAGISYDGGAFLLKTPLEVGASWAGEHGGTTRIEAMDADVTVPAGHFTGCLRTVEEGGRPPGSRYATTYCPGVGMVLLEVAANGASARAALKSHGPPVQIR